jgi:hypothetical protein
MENRMLDTLNLSTLDTLARRAIMALAANCLCDKWETGHDRSCPFGIAWDEFRCAFSPEVALRLTEAIRTLAGREWANPTCPNCGFEEGQGWASMQLLKMSGIVDSPKS